MKLEMSHDESGRELRPRFYALLGCSFLYTVLSLVLFAAPLMRVQRRILAVEGDLRYVLVRLREHAESIAFFRGPGYERECSEKVLDRVIWRRGAMLFRCCFVQF